MNKDLISFCDFTIYRFLDGERIGEDAVLIPYLLLYVNLNFYLLWYLADDCGNWYYWNCGQVITLRFSTIFGGNACLNANLIVEFLFPGSQLVILNLCNPLNAWCHIAFDEVNRFYGDNSNIFCNKSIESHEQLIIE